MEVQGDKTAVIKPYPLMYIIITIIINEINKKGSS